MKKYYPNEDMECGRSALANLLVELNDPIAAEMTYNNFRKHPLVNNRGMMHGAFLPRILRAITNGGYSGIIYCHVDPYLEKDLKIAYDNQWEDKLKIIREEQNLGTIREAPSMLEVRLPTILGIKTKFGSMLSEGQVKLVSYPDDNGHVIVMKDSETFIDNGFEMNYKLNDLEVISVFEAVKEK